jgi:hypothetical protein
MVHSVILVIFSPGGATTNAGHYQGTLAELKEAVGCKRPELLLHDNA